MFLLRQSIQSLFAKTQDLLYSEGFNTNSGGNASIIMSYPQKEDQLPIIRPVIIVSSMIGFDSPIELGSNDGTEVLVIIDVIAKDDAQRDDLGYMLIKNLRNRVLPIYDFSTKFPSNIGDYTGINTVGKMTILGTSFSNIEPDINDIWALEHHQEIRVRLGIPSD